LPHRGITAGVYIIKAIHIKSADRTMTLAGPVLVRVG